MEPLHRFEATKAARNSQLANHDLRTLALMVFDAVIERMGLAAGASHEQVLRALEPLICAGEPEATPERVGEVTTKILDFLVNENERRRAFCEEIRIVEGATQVTREISFHYLQQVLGPNDEPLYRATVEGINLYTGTLGLDVEDAQAANAAVLERAGGAIRLKQDDFTPERLAAELTRLAASPERLQAMAVAARSAGAIDAAERLADLVCRLQSS